MMGLEEWMGTRMCKDGTMGNDKMGTRVTTRTKRYWFDGDRDKRGSGQVKEIGKRVEGDKG